MKNIKRLIFAFLLCCAIQGVWAEGNLPDSISEDFEMEWNFLRSPMLIRVSRFADTKFPYFPGFDDYPRKFLQGNIVNGKNYVSYEVDMTDYSLYSYVTEENMKRFSATGDSLYLRNVVKYVKYVPDNNDNSSRYYIVTYIPTDDVVKNLINYKNLCYPHVNKQFTGIVIKYSLRGDFKGGFVYKNGKRKREIVKNQVGEKLRLKRVFRKRERKTDTVLPYIVEKWERTGSVHIKSGDIGEALRGMEKMHPTYCIMIRDKDYEIAYNRNVVNEFINKVFTKEQKAMFYNLTKHQRASVGNILSYFDSLGRVKYVSLSLPMTLYDTMSNEQIEFLWQNVCNLSVPTCFLSLEKEDTNTYIMGYSLFDEHTEDENISDADIEAALPVIVPVKNK